MSEETPIKALIISKQPVIRRGLEAFLALIANVEAVRATSDAHEAVALIKTLEPDVVLMDVVESDQALIEFTAEVRQKFPEIRIVVLSGDVNTEMVNMVISTGVDSWILQNVTLSTFTSAVRSTMDGAGIFAPEITRKVSDATKQPLSSRVRLTKRESQVLTLMGKGLRNQEIADNLHISYATVKYHVTNILAKLGATHRSQAIAIALKRGLIPKGKR